MACKDRKTPITSLVSERHEKYNFDTKADNAGFRGVLSRLTGGDKKNSKERRLMQLKVRVKGILDLLLGSTRTKTSESGSTQNLPIEIVDFLAKYFASDNIAWPKEYLWVVEEEQLEFNELNLTRRMTFIEHEAEDLDEGEEEDINARFARTNTDRVQMLLLNFLIGRILINHVIVR